jgi:hypothetical protein
MELGSVVEAVSADVGGGNGAPLYIESFQSLCMHCGENVFSLCLFSVFSLIPKKINQSFMIKPPNSSKIINISKSYI